MEPFGIGMAGLGVAGLVDPRRLRAGVPAAAPAAEGERRGGRRPAARPRSAADRLEALGRGPGRARRCGSTRSPPRARRRPEERLQAMAGQLLGLIRDKNATLETALAGLDQLRARMRALEQMGEPAEARALLDGLGGRLDALQAAQAAADGRRSRRGSPRSAARAGGRRSPSGWPGSRRSAPPGSRRARPARAARGAARRARAAGDAERAAGREALKRLEAQLEALRRPRPARRGPSSRR